MSLLEEIEEAIGRPATIELTRVYGGGVLRVPESVDPCHPLAVTIGMTAANTLCREFRAMILEIPSERASLLRARNDEIVAAYVDGASVRGLANHHRISRKMVRKILKSRGITLRGADYGERSHVTS